MAHSQTWDSSFEASPVNTDMIGAGNEAMQQERLAIRERLADEHEWSPTGVQSRHGVHKAGAAVCWYQAGAPTTIPNGATLGALDSGRIWVNSTTKVMKIWNGTAFEDFKANDFVANGVTDAALRQGTALSLIGRSANTLGNVADIVATAASGAVLRESGSTIGFGQIATAGIADNAITNVKIRDSGALTVIGRSTNTVGDPADIAAVAASGAVLRESGSVIGFGTIATAGIADAAVTHAKHANMSALSIAGRSANTVGVPADIVAVAASGAILRESGSTIGFGTIATAGITDHAITYPKIQQASVGFAILGKATTGAGDYAEIVTTTGTNAVLRESGGALGFGQVATAGITDHAVTYAKLQQSSVGFTVLGKAATGAGDFAEIATTTGSAAVLRESAGAIGFGQIATAGIANNAVDNTKIRQGGALTVIGVAGNATANVADIAGTASSDAVLRVSGTTLGFGTVATAGITNAAVTYAKIQNVGALGIMGRSANTTGVGADIVAVAASGAVLRESGSTIGFGTIATAGITDAAVTYAKIANLGALAVMGRSANTAGVGADISATAASGAVLRESGSTIGFGQIATAGIADGAVSTIKVANNAVDNTKLAQMAAWTVKANATALLANASDITLDTDGTLAANLDTRIATQKAIVTYVNNQVASGGVGNDTITNVKLANMPALTVKANPTNAVADPADLAATAASGAVLRESGSTLGFGQITTAGITDAAVTHAKIQNLSALSVPGRSANTTGVGADIVATAASGAVLRESGSTLGFGQIATAGITDAAITYAKIQNIGALSVAGRSANTAGVGGDIAATAASGAVLRESGSVLGFGTIATAGIANDAVDNTKIRNSGALSVIGRSANSVGDPADIAATAASGAVLRESGSVIGFGTIATAGIADAAVTNAKLADMANATVKGRNTAGTGVPEDMTMAQLQQYAKYEDFDIVIDSDAKLATWAASPATYPHVLVKAGTWNLSFSTQIAIDLSGVTNSMVIGEVGSVLALSTTYASAAAVSGVKSGVYIENITVTLVKASGSATSLSNFDGCSDLIKCTTTIGGATAGYGFNTCTRLNNCFVHISASSSAMIGFNSCTSLSSCTGQVEGIYSGTVLTIFSQCNGLSLCNATTLAPYVHTSPFYGFANCNQLSNCSATLTSASTIGFTVYGFYTCNRLNNCLASWSDVVSGVGTFYGFNACSYLMGCNSSVSAFSSALAISYQVCIGLTLCLSTQASNSGTGSGYGFANCKNMWENFAVSSKSGNTANYVDNGTAQAVANTAAGGWNNLA